MTPTLDQAPNRTVYGIENIFLPASPQPGEPIHSWLSPSVATRATKYNVGKSLRHTLGSRCGSDLTFVLTTKHSVLDVWEIQHFFATARTTFRPSSSWTLLVQGHMIYPSPTLSVSPNEQARSWLFGIKSTRAERLRRERFSKLGLWSLGFEGG